MTDDAHLYEQAIIALARQIHCRNVEIISLKEELARLKLKEALARLKQERKGKEWLQSRA